jgi:thiosulfate/3-mercaptopyruvate sulfurtransferase
MKLTGLRLGPIGILTLLMLSILVGGSYVKNESVTAGGFGEENGIADRSLSFRAMLKSIEEVSTSDVLLDISQNSTKHIKDSIAIPYTDFTQAGGPPKSGLEISNILGAAGISHDDHVVIYGECMPCGGGPAPATYVYWILKTMGQENVSVLDGNIDDWAAAGLPTSNESEVRPATNYTPELNLESVGSYEYVKSGEAQLVDARTFQEFNVSSIPKAINIPSDSVLDNKTIKNETALKSVFIDLNRDKPVVVFTNTGVKASVVWFALELMGYDAKLYAYQNWVANKAYEGNLGA